MKGKRVSTLSRLLFWSTLMITFLGVAFNQQTYASTVTYWDDPSSNKYIGGTGGQPQTYQVTFNITVPPQEILQAASLSVYLVDDEINDPVEAANIYLNGSLIQGQATITNGGASVFTYEVTNYLSDHTLTLMITRHNGGGQGKNDFYYDKAGLSVTTLPVPAPSSLLLLMSGLLGLAFMARRRGTRGRPR